MAYEYKFPMIGKDLPGHIVKQIPGESFNWSWDDKVSTYVTNMRHKELEEFDDVEFREWTPEPIKSAPASVETPDYKSMKRAELDSVAKTLKINPKKYPKKEDLLKVVLKKV